MALTSSTRAPGIWSGIGWAFHSASGGLLTRLHLAGRALRSVLWHSRAMRRWMTVVSELHSRGIVADLPAEYLRAVRPYVHRGTGMSTRAVQLIDHADWLETALQVPAFGQIAAGRPLVLAELPAPRGYEYMRLQLQRTAPHSPEGALLLTLTLQRAADIQHKAAPVEAAAICFSRFRVDGTGCLVIGGVRGQRHPVLRLSSVELGQALSGWKPPVLMVRVAQELARYWGLHLIALDPAWHRLHGWPYSWSRRYRAAAQKIYESYDALWEHFEATRGPQGWMVLPLHSDEKLAATALSPEKRARQTHRADYWIRTRNLLRSGFRQQLQRPGFEARLSRVTQSMAPETLAADEFDDPDFQRSEDLVPSRVLETGPGTLL
jgi:uncharacterized protein VirK/YbjX